MRAAELVPVEQYLATSFHPDRDYVDGEVLERNVGERDHSDLQGELVYYFRSRRKQWHVYEFPEQRLQVTPTRYRIPDVCVVVANKPAGQVFHEPPFICIEVLAKDDTLDDLQARIDDYLNFGVPYVWVINPRARRAWVHTRSSIEEMKDSVMRTQNPEFVIDLREVFSGIDETER